jgi:hypothetical protein
MVAFVQSAVYIIRCSVQHSHAWSRSGLLRVVYSVSNVSCDMSLLHTDISQDTAYRSSMRMLCCASCMLACMLNVYEMQFVTTFACSRYMQLVYHSSVDRHYILPTGCSVYVSSGARSTSLPAAVCSNIKRTQR